MAIRLNVFYWTTDNKCTFQLVFKQILVINIIYDGIWKNSKVLFHGISGWFSQKMRKHIEWKVHGHFRLDMTLFISENRNWNSFFEKQIFVLSRYIKEITFNWQSDSIVSEIKREQMKNVTHLQNVFESEQRVFQHLITVNRMQNREKKMLFSPKNL